MEIYLYIFFVISTYICLRLIFGGGNIWIIIVSIFSPIIIFILLILTILNILIKHDT